jgi:hypothetical protein
MIECYLVIARATLKTALLQKSEGISPWSYGNKELKHVNYEIKVGYDANGIMF